jgi:hypothetical protein
MASKFEQFLKDNKIDPRRLLVASGKLERLRPEDRAARLARRRKSGDKAEAPKAEGEEKKSAGKPRSGRPITSRLLSAASSGKPVTGPAKTRLLRAVNHVLEQKKKQPVELKALF